MHMKQFSLESRKTAYRRFSSEEFDLLVIGGGITGAGIALDATARGLKTALIEKRDFAAGTSSRSTKLIHGGLRYLENLEFGLVREGLKERLILSRTAPHLAEPFPFLIPIYKDSHRNYDHPLKMRAGLILYDLLAGKYRFGRHRRLSRDEAIEFAPQLEQTGLRGAFLYYDGLTNDSRLVIEVIKAAHDLGSAIANYTEAIGFLKRADGQIGGARARDLMTGAEAEIRSRITINATGVWVNDVARLDDGVDRTLTKSIRPSKGIHLTVSAGRLKVRGSWLIPSLDGHRFYFVVPWEGRVNIGTTDTDYDGSKDSPRAEAGEMTEILDAINSYFPAAQLGQEDVISSWAGLRPLISDAGASNTSGISRKDEIFESGDGLISISGGKLTTYRLMAEQAVDLAARRLKQRFDIRATDAGTEDLAVSGGIHTRSDLEDFALILAENEKLNTETARHLVFSYGSNHQQIVELMRGDESLRMPLIEGLPVLCAELVYAVRYEAALTIADVLTRRTRLALIAGSAALGCLDTVADLMAKELAWNDEEKRRQISDFRAEFEAEYTVI